MSDHELDAILGPVAVELSAESRRREMDRTLGDIAAAFSAEFLQVLGSPTAKLLPPKVITLAGVMAAAAVAAGREVRGTLNGVLCDLSEAYRVAVALGESEVHS